MHIYVQKGLISEDQYLQALEYQKKTKLSLHESLIRLSFIKEERVISYCDRILAN